MNVSVGVVNYRSYRWLETCLRSLQRQSLQPQEIWVIDNAFDPAEAAKIQATHPRVTYVGHSANWGFAPSANYVVRNAYPKNDVLILNADTRLAEDFIRELASFHGEERAGVLGGILFRPDGQVDTAGIELRRNGRARDLQPAAADLPHDPMPVFAVCGAAIYLRRGLIDDLRAAHGEWFDESFFLYHEDVDLAWRARWLGWSCWTIPSARGEHRRGWRLGRRPEIPGYIRRHSFKNHYLRLTKNAPISLLLRDAPHLLGWEVLRAGYALLRERDVLPGYLMALRHLPAALRKRARIFANRRVSPREIRGWIRG